MLFQTKDSPKNAIDEKIENLQFLVLFNDDHNTFDYVIECLVFICGHTYEQAEQSALIAHTKGKCTINEGTFDELKPIKDALIEAGLSAIISN
jgi:ATP-dependent Clp protease adaptor protein ClpS